MLILTVSFCTRRHFFQGIQTANMLVTQHFSTTLHQGRQRFQQATWPIIQAGLRSGLTPWTWTRRVSGRKVCWPFKPITSSIAVTPLSIQRIWVIIWRPQMDYFEFRTWLKMRSSVLKVTSRCGVVFGRTAILMRTLPTMCSSTTTPL